MKPRFKSATYEGVCHGYTNKKYKCFLYASIFGSPLIIAAFLTDGFGVPNKKAQRFVEMIGSEIYN